MKSSLVILLLLIGCGPFNKPNLANKNKETTKKCVAIDIPLLAKNCSASQINEHRYCDGIGCSIEGTQCLFSREKYLSHMNATCGEISKKNECVSIQYYFGHACEWNED